MNIAARVESHLREQGVAFALLSHKATGSTHESASAAHIAEDHIAKAVMVHDGAGDAMVVIPGDTWLRLEALSQDLNRRFELEEESELTHLFPDCAPGAIPPLGAAYGIETFLDESLTSLANVYFEAGDHEHLIQVAGDDFLKLTRGLRRGHYSNSH